MFCAFLKEIEKVFLFITSYIFFYVAPVHGHWCKMRCDYSVCFCYILLYSLPVSLSLLSSPPAFSVPPNASLIPSHTEVYIFMHICCNIFCKIPCSLIVSLVLCCFYLIHCHNNIIYFNYCLCVSTLSFTELQLGSSELAFYSFPPSSLSPSLPSFISFISFSLCICLSVLNWRLKNPHCELHRSTF